MMHKCLHRIVQQPWSLYQAETA